MNITGRRVVLGLCMLCALMVSAVAAQGASAASKGTTIVTCKAGFGNLGSTFSDAHCKTGGIGFGHYAVAAETTTELEGSNNTTGAEVSIAKLHTVQAGIEEEIQAKVLKFGTGSTSWVINRTTGKEHYFEGEGRLLLEEGEVTKPAGKGCQIKGGSLETNQVRATSMASEADPKLNEEMVVKLEPASGTTFAEFEMEGCTKESLNGVYSITGSIKVTPNGATFQSTRAGSTAQGTLKMRGQNAGLDGSITLRGRDPSLGETEYTPLSVTTIETE